METLTPPPYEASTTLAYMNLSVEMKNLKEELENEINEKYFLEDLWRKTEIKTVERYRQGFINGFCTGVAVILISIKIFQ